MENKSTKIRQSQTAEAKKLRKLFNPYCSKYIRKVPVGGLFPGHQWITFNNHLTLGIIQKAYQEKMEASWFSTFSSQILAVDLDDHKGKAWTGLSPKVLQLYDDVLRHLTRPSLLVQSPRGLHLYWILSFGIPSAELKYLACQKLQGLPVEIKYTAKESLRIPGSRRFRDVLTFDFLSSVNINELDVYHPAEILGEDCLPDNITSYRERVTRIENAKIKWNNIEQAEASILPIENGQSNEQFLKLILIYRCAGMSEEKAFKQFKWALQRSPGYVGELVQRPERLWQKIVCEYKQNPRHTIDKGWAQKEIFDDSVIKHLVNIHPFAKQRTKPIEQFLSKILWARNLHMGILKDRAMMAFMNYKYTTIYGRNVQNGYIPLAQNFLRNINFRYFEIMTWLKNIGFLEPKNFEYEEMGKKKVVQFSHKLNICKFYKINSEMFL